MTGHCREMVSMPGLVGEGHRRLLLLISWLPRANNSGLIQGILTAYVFFLIGLVSRNLCHIERGKSVWVEVGLW